MLRSSRVTRAVASWLSLMPTTTSWMNFWASSKGLNKLRKSVIDTEQQCLTPPESATIIATLCAVEADEKRLARKVVMLQAAVALIAAGIIYGLNDAQQYALAVLCGG